MFHIIASVFSLALYVRWNRITIIKRVVRIIYTFFFFFFVCYSTGIGILHIRGLVIINILSFFSSITHGVLRNLVTMKTREINFEELSVIVGGKFLAVLPTKRLS